ncbi:MAG: glycosyltransferase [Patescibacteria group bacterium]
MKTLQVSVVMSVYNGEAFLRDAIDSILAQTYKDFEFVIVNDGSTDGSESIIKSYNDPRIKLFSQDNEGLVAGLNKGIEQSSGEYIARQDADDMSEPTRLQKQLGLLQADEELVIVGSSMKVMDGAGKVLHEHRVLLNDPELEQELLIRSPFAHGSVVFRKSAYDKAGGYTQDEWPAEDYGLWLRMASFGKFANVDEPLYVYRDNAAGISAQNSTQQDGKRDALRLKAWSTRKTLLPKHLLTAGYVDLEMGQLQVERIASNLLFVLRKSLRRANLPTTITCLKLLLTDRGLRRKCARLIGVRLGLKHV